MKYKVGDKVKIKSFDWYNKNKSKRGNISFPYEAEVVFTSEMSSFCGQIVTISQKGYTQDVGFYRIKEDRGSYMWTDEMIEGLMEEEVFIKANDIYNEEYSKGEYCHEQSFKWGFQEGYNYSHENDKLEISLKEGYQFVDENGNVINATKIVLEKKNVLEKKSPKTDDIIKWLREHDMTKYIGVIYSGMCSITFDTEGLIKDFLKTVEDNE